MGEIIFREIRKTMKSNRNPLNLRTVYETSMMTELDKIRITSYWTNLQDLIRRNCNEGHDPIPFYFKPDRNSAELFLEFSYEDKIECMKEQIKEIPCEIEKLRKELLDWLCQ